MSKARPPSGSLDAPTTAKTLTPPLTRKLPPYKVLLHNDDVNDMDYVTRCIMELVSLTRLDAEKRMMEAHKNGTALLLVTHKEAAELKQEQFASKNLTVTIEPAE